MSDPPAGRLPSGLHAEEDAAAAPRRPTLALGCLGGLAGWLFGVIVNLALADLSITLGYRGRAEVPGIAAMVAMTIVLRRLHARAPLRRFTRWSFLTSAAVAAAVAAFRLAPGVLALAIVAGVLIACAAGLAPDTEAAVRLLAGAAVILVGMAVAGVGADMLAKRDVTLSAAVIVAGVAVAGVGVAMLADREVLVHAALAAVGVAAAGVGVAMLVDREEAVGAALTVFGAAVVWAGAAMLAGTEVLIDAAVILAAVAVVGIGAVILAKADVTVGGAFMTAGVAVVGAVTAMLAKRGVSVGTAGIGAVMTAVVVEAAMLANREALFSAAAVEVSIALVTCWVTIVGLASIRSNLGRLGRWAVDPPQTREDQRSSS
jgi:hypothetical protein